MSVRQSRLLLYKKVLLSLIKLGIGNAEVMDVPEEIDWKVIEALAARQGLSAVLVDGVEKLPPEQKPPRKIVLKWIGTTLRSYEKKNVLYQRAIAEMAGWYNAHGFKMMVLKGFACSLDWTNPKHRPCGDIDIWQFGQQKEADALLVKEKGIKVSNSKHHHTMFFWGNFMVENHYDFINTHRHYSHRGLEQMFKELGQDDSHYVEVLGEKVYLPSPNLHALFLVRHALNHFPSIGLNLRQVLDWAFFVEKHHGEIDWQWLTGVLEEYHMTDFYHCLNAICVEDLGFDAAAFPKVRCEQQLRDRVLNDILFPAKKNKTPDSIFQRIPFKYRRWRDNEWKHKLCYSESMWGAFWSGVWGFILKPSSFWTD